MQAGHCLGVLGGYHILGVDHDRARRLHPAQPVAQSSTSCRYVFQRDKRPIRNEPATRIPRPNRGLEDTKYVVEKLQVTVRKGRSAFSLHCTASQASLTSKDATIFL
jgi:hypothetical protein